MLPIGPILLTREQYDEALALLPDPETFPEDTCEIDVDGASLMRKVGMTDVPGTERWPMIVCFKKACLPEGVFHDDAGRICWQLEASFQII